MRKKYHILGKWAKYSLSRDRTLHMIEESKNKYYDKMLINLKDPKYL